MNVYRLAAKFTFTFLIVICSMALVKAEGTKQLSPTAADEVLLHTNAPGFANFAAFDGPEISRLYIRINDFNNEIVYIGLSAEVDDNGMFMASPASYQFRIVAPDGDVAFGPFTVNLTNQNTPTWALASTGPDALFGGGYSTNTANHPYAIFDPSILPNAMMNGDYRLEFADIPASGVNVKWFDFTVASGGNEIPGRLWSNTWALRTPQISPDPPQCGWDRPFNGTFYSFTEEGFVSLVDFNNSGFQGLSFTVAFGETGPGSTGNLIEDRKSTNMGDSTANAADHMVFVSEPDPLVFITPPNLCGDVEFFGVSCDENGVCIEIGVTRKGQVEVILDFFGANNMFDPGTEDVILAMMFDEPDTTCLYWDGLKGNGMAPDFDEDIPTFVRYSQGIQHYAAYDLEYLLNGYCVETIRPVCTGMSNLLYWDDSNLTDFVGTGVDESDPGTGQPQIQLNGCVCGVDGCRTWSNYQLGTNPNLCSGTPAGYGNERTLNTWWFAASVNLGPFDLLLVRAQIAGDSLVCPDETTEFTVMTNPDTIDYDYTWSGPGGFMANTQNTGPVGTAGTYYVTIFDPGTNCMAVDSVEFMVSEEIMTSIDFTCLGGNSPNADIDLTITGGVPPFDILWSTGAMTEDLTNVMPGEYTVMVTDANDCIALDTVLVEECCTLDILCPPADGGQFACVTAVPAPDTTLITVNDFCVSVMIDASDSDNGGAGCPMDPLVITRTYTVTDGIGNVETCVQTFTVIDDVAPTLNTGTCPADITVNCDEGTSADDLGIPSFMDNCTATGSITIDIDDVTTGFDGSCTNMVVGTITRTFTATDLCGNVNSSCVQVITVVDMEAPTFTTPPDITIQCTQDTFPATTGDVTDEADNCSSVIEVDFSDSFMSGTCPVIDIITRTWTATDECGNVSTGVQTITREDQTPPTFTTPANTTVECTVDPTPDVTGDVMDAMDICGDVTVEFMDMTEMGQCPVTEIITRTWTVTDECGNTATGVQTIQVFDFSGPTFTVPADLTIDCSADTSATTNGLVTDAMDECEDVTVSYTDFVVDGQCPATDTIYRNWVVTDGCGNTATGVQSITLVDMTPPTFTTPANITIECGIDPIEAITGTVDDAADDCSDFEIDFTDITVAGECPAVDSIYRTWIVTDDCDNSSTGVQIITRVDTVGPNFLTPSDVTIQCSDDVDDLELTGDVEQSSDNCDGVTTDYMDMLVLGNCSGSDTIFRTWTAMDDCGNTSTDVQTIVLIDDTPPTFTIPGDITIECDQDTLPSTTGDVTATNDNCSEVTTSFSDMIVMGTCPAVDTIFRTWMVMDDCGNSATDIQTIVREDTEAPTFTVPIDLTIPCDADTSTAFTGFATDIADNCSMANVGYTDNVTSGDCPVIDIITRNWFATDACGNSTFMTQTITTIDTVAPMPVPGTCPEDITVACGDDIPEAEFPEGMDNCSDVSVSMNEVIVGFVPPSVEGQIIRTFYLEDDCGNIDSSCVQTVFVVDTIAPMVICPEDVSLVCGADSDTSVTGVPTFTDNCSDPADFTLTFEDDSVGFSGLCVDGTIERTFTITDPDGNVNTCVQSIAIFDTLAPTFDLPVDITVDCEIDLDDLSILGNVSNVMDCSTVTDTSYIDMFGMMGCDGTGEIFRTWTVTDACGNSGTGVQMIFVQDTVPPDLTPPADVTISCDQDPGDTTLTGGVVIVMDECSMEFMLEYEDDTTNLDGCNGTGFIIRTWYAGDGCENFTEMSQIITVIDTTGPVTMCQDITINFDADPIMSITPDMVDAGSFDACGDITLSLSQSTFDCIEFRDNPTKTIQLIATDECGNTSACNVQVTGEGGGGIILDCPADISVNLESGECLFYFDYELTAERRCGTEDPILVQIDTSGLTGGDGFPIGVTNQSYVAYNSLGDTVFCSFNVYVFENIQTTNTLACNDQVNISLDENCEAFINPDVLLEGGDYSCFDDFIVAVQGVDTAFGGVMLNLDNIEVGNTYIVAITDTKTGISCWGTILVEEKYRPIVDCIDVEILCTTPLEPVFAEPDTQLLPYAPPATDNCGPIFYDYEDTFFESACGLDSIHRLWTITDGYGNVTICNQLITVISANLDEVVFPEAYQGPCDGSSSPAVTGWPTFGGVPISIDPLCNVWAWYDDVQILDCGGGLKIVRKWTVFNGCTQEFVHHNQGIKLTDLEGPELTCPEDQTYGTDPWFCNADIPLIAPVGTDACGSEFTLTPIVPLGVGTLTNSGGTYVWNDVPEGTWTIEWVAEDECENTSSCTYDITIVDDIPPVAACDFHTIVSLTEDMNLDRGLTKIPASVFDDGSFDNCSDVTLDVRRLESCIEFDWTTNGAGIDEDPNGIVDSRDRGTVHRPKVPFACCDAGAGPIMIELKVTDAEGNFNLCMVEVEVQDKLAPFIQCPPGIIVSCDYWFAAEETAGFIPQDQDQLSAVFGRILDEYEYDESDRQQIIINDPGNDELSQPHIWGLDGWADDNCNVDIDVRVRLFDDCSGNELPDNSEFPKPANAVRLVERTFRATDPQGNISTCRQFIWVVDFDPFYIEDQTCNNPDPNDGVIWPCDIELTNCPSGDLTPEDLNSMPTIFDDNCSITGVEWEDKRFEFVDNACFKIIRTWTVIDWCQYDNITGAGYWQYDQVIKVLDQEGPEFDNCPVTPQTFCVEDANVELPANNQVFLGEDNPLASSCSVHIWMNRIVEEMCSDYVEYDVKVYPYNGASFLQLVQKTQVDVVNDTALLTFDTRTSALLDVRTNGLPYNSQFCDDEYYHRILWTVEDGCGNISTCEYLFRLEDCKKPSPVCINGLSTVVMPSGGEVTIWAADFNASSFDDCTPKDDLLYSFDGTLYQPSRIFSCDDIIENGGPSFLVDIWVADAGNDDDCDGQIEWSERNKDFCTTFIIVEDNDNVCEGDSAGIAGVILTDDLVNVAQVGVNLFNPNETYPEFTTEAEGYYYFFQLPHYQNYTIVPDRNDDHKNGVSTLDLVRIQRHLLGQEMLENPYKYIAADANNSQSITVSDIVEIRKVILGIFEEFPNNTSWRFVGLDYDFIDPYSPWPFEEVIQLNNLGQMSMHNDFVGIKVGDVNNSVQANANQLEVRSARKTLEFLVAEQDVNPGDVIRMPVYAGVEEITGFQFTLETPGFEFVRIESGALDVSRDYLGIFEGALTMSWNEAQATRLEGGEELFTLVLKATTPGSLGDRLLLSSRITDAEAYVPGAENTVEIANLELVIDQREAEQPVSDEGFALYQNQPNPWNDETSIGFTIPRPMHVKLTVYDLSGKLLLVKELEAGQGYSEFILTDKELSGSSIMYYRLDASVTDAQQSGIQDEKQESYSASKKMLMVR